MTNTQIQAIRLLRGCTFQPATYVKRFVRSLSEISDKENYELSEKQRLYLWKLVYQYRRQHGDKWFTAHAENLLEKWKNQQTAINEENETDNRTD